MKKLFIGLLLLLIVAQSCTTTHFFQSYAPATSIKVKDANDSTLLSVQVPKGKFGISTKYFTTGTCTLTIGEQIIPLTAKH